MFQFTRSASIAGVATSRNRLLHSDIHGSKPTCGSPWLFAAYRVLHRLETPRHPPYALHNLTIFSDGCFSVILCHFFARFGQRTAVRFPSLAQRSLSNEKSSHHKQLIACNQQIRWLLKVIHSVWCLCFVCFRLNPKMFSTHHCLTLSVEPWLIDTF